MIIKDANVMLQYLKLKFKYWLVMILKILEIGIDKFYLACKCFLNELRNFYRRSLSLFRK